MVDKRLGSTLSSDQESIHLSVLVHSTLPPTYLSPYSVLSLHITIIIKVSEIQVSSNRRYIHYGGMYGDDFLSILMLALVLMLV